MVPYKLGTIPSSHDNVFVNPVTLMQILRVMLKFGANL